MGVVAGVFSSGQPDAGLQVRDVNRNISRDWANIGVLTVALNHLGQRAPAHNFKAEWIERGEFPKQDTVTATQTAGDGTIGVANLSYHRNGDIIEVISTGEWILVTNAAVNPMVVTRAYAGTSAASIPNGSAILTHNAQNTEGGSPPPDTVLEDTNPYNLIEIFEEEVRVTDLDAEIEFYNENPWDKGRTEAYRKILTNVEIAVLKGLRYSTGSNTSVIRHMGGLDYYCTSNVVSGGPLSWTAFKDWLTLPMRSGALPENMVMIAGDGIIKQIDAWAEAIPTFFVRPSDTVLGHRLTQISHSHFGAVDVVWHPLMGGALASGLSNWAYIVDLSKLKLRYWPKRDMVYMDIPRDDSRTAKKKWSAYYSLEVKNPTHHGVLKNIATFSNS